MSRKEDTEAPELVVQEISDNKISRVKSLIEQTQAKGAHLFFHM